MKQEPRIIIANFNAGAKDKRKYDYSLKIKKEKSKPGCFTWNDYPFGIY